MVRLRSLVITLVALSALSVHGATQAADFRVLDAGPAGELAQREDANEIRVIFSEPMVALGRIPSNPTPPWIHITPAIQGRYRWSGTTILIFTPDPDAPLPFATTYTVTVDETAASEAGRRLRAPFTFSFTTPTVTLTSMRWYRRDGRFDRPVVLILDFNQPVRAADAAAHASLRYQRHDFDPPVMTAADRSRMAAAEPAGLRLYDARVAAARRAADRTDAVPVRPAADWDRERFPPAPARVALETTSVPDPGTWLELTLDTGLRGTAGPATPRQAQTSVAELPPVFLVRGVGCHDRCNPSGYNGIELSVPVAVSRFAAALSLRDLTNPPAERPVPRTTPVRATALDEVTAAGIEDGGYERQPPATTYGYRLDAALTATDGQTLGYPWTAVVENWHERAFTSFGDGHGVWEAAGGPLLPFYSRNFQSVTQWIAPVAPPDLVRRLVALEQNHFRDLPPGPGTARRLTVTPDATQSYGLDLRPSLPSNGTGLFWAGLRPGTPIARSESAVSDADGRSTLVQVTNLGISVKDSPQSTLVFVTRLDNGEPVPDAAVTIFDTSSRQLWRGTSNRDGVAMAPALPLRKPDDWYSLSFLVTAEKGGDVAYLGSDWNEGIQPWDFGSAFQLWESTDILRGAVFTDRGVYRPGEEVHVKAVVRTDTPSGIRLLPAGSRLEIVVRDGRNREVDRRTVTVNRWSSAEWTWAVPADATLGAYRVHAMIPGTERPAGNDTADRAPRGEWLKAIDGVFTVAAYRRPDFRVDAILTPSSAAAGATLDGRIEARYLFGSALSGRPVHWSITRDLAYDIPDAIRERYPEERWVFGYAPDREIATERIAGGDGSLDASGQLAVTASSTRDVDLPYRYTLEADVEDVSRQHIANTASTLVHPAPWYIGLRRPSFFAETSTGTSVDVVAAGLDGTAVAGVPITLTLTQVQWNSVRRAEGGGFYTWDTEEVRTPAGQWSITSAAAPAHVDIPVPSGGYYVLTAVGRDAEGRATKSETSFYGVGRGYTAWQRYDHNRIDLQPEKKTWKPGETARLMIQSPWESATALLTVEREGVRRYERFTLSSTQQTVTVPITADDIPNVFVSVLLIRGRTSADPGPDGSDPGKPAFRLGYAELRVEDAEKRLAVRVNADRAAYRPANVAHVSVALADAAARPVAGEVTLWAVDYGVLSLTGYQMPDILHGVYRDKALQVMNEDSRQRLVSRRVLTPKGAGEGGGGGGRDDGAADVRRDFRPLAFWLGSVETDASGRAARDVMLPESLTTYRIMAVAGDTASRFGSADAEITVTKPVTLVAAFPRFLTLGDRASFGAVLTNTLATGGQAVVTVQSLDPSVLQFDGSLSQTIVMTARATEPVRFNATARAVGPARVRITATLGAERDAFETTIPVTAPAPVTTVAASGQTDARTVERLALPAGVLPGGGGLDVELASTALVGLGEGARYLVDYGYPCAEQKSSAALALLLAADLGSAFAMDRIAPAEYGVRANTLLRELPKYQCTDGGFGYWPGACQRGTVYLTAYVLHVMHAARALGVEPDGDVVRRALDFLDGQLKTAVPPGEVQWQPVWAAGNAFSVKVLAEYGRTQDSNITRLSGLADRLPVFALSYLADAMAAAGIRDSRYDEVIRRLTNALRVEGDRAHVEEIDQDALAWVWSSNVRSSAIVLQGFVDRGDAPDWADRLVRGLLAARRDGRWSNTQENATALGALVAYYKVFEREAPDMTATLQIAGRAIGTATFRGRSAAAQQVRLAMPDLMRQIPAGAERDLAVSRAGTGRLFYTARLRYVSADPPPAAEQGIRVERRYERYVESGDSPAATSFAAGDLVRVTLTITVPQERRYVAVTDPMPAGVEAVDSWFRTTASDLSRDASVQRADGRDDWWWLRGGFDHVEKYDDHVSLFATRLGEGRHQFSYLVRATTTGSFRAAGTWAEEMYAPEVSGRAAPALIEIR
jgi:uncharacterized protein YfaS (alpha-2-macroglobulin family)